MSMTNPAIHVEGLGKQYWLGGTSGRTAYDALAMVFSVPLRRWRSRSADPPSALWALRDVSFDVGWGEVVGIIGRNGAGKSTLLKVLSRITTPTEGAADLYGRITSLLEVGTGFHPELTGRDNIFLNGAVLGMRRAEIAYRFDEIVAFAEVERFLDTPVKHYSSGMYLRLAFAVAAHLHSEILLVDEVLAVGDAAFQKKCLGKMGDVVKTGRTVLFVSHNMTAVRSLCSRAHLLSEGRLDFSGPTDECVDRYLRTVSEDMPSTVRTGELPRPSVVADETGLRITGVQMITPGHSAVLPTADPMVLRIDILVQQPLEDVVIAWSVHSSDGTRLFECRSLDSYGVIQRLSPGAYSIQSRVGRNPLNPGLYTLHVGARCSAKGLDWLPDVLTFRVESSARLGSLWLEAPSGWIRVPSEWSRPETLAPRYGPEANGEDGVGA
jgi:lipopolysaccharide transport system ATP-binding protein